MTPVESSESTLADRVNYLIGLHFGGSVNAAATEFHLPQRTLARIANGQSKSPPSQTLARVAQGFGVTVDWLLTGRGQGPSGPRPPQDVPSGRWTSALYRRFRNLELPAVEQEVMLDVVLASLHAARALESYLARRPDGKAPIPLPDDWQPPARCGELLEDVCRAWNRYLAEIEFDTGAERIRNALTDRSSLLLTYLALGAGTASIAVVEELKPDLSASAEFKEVASRLVRDTKALLDLPEAGSLGWGVSHFVGGDSNELVSGGERSDKKSKRTAGIRGAGALTPKAKRARKAKHV